MEKFVLNVRLLPSNNNGLKSMKVTSFELTDVGGIPHLKLESTNPQMNIICGENGVGKTNILDSIAFAFSENDQSVVLKKSGTNEGKVFVEFISSQGGKSGFNANISNSFPTTDHISSYNNNPYYTHNKNNLLYLKVNRVFNYKKESSINADPDPTNRGRYNSSGLKNEDIKQWFISRHLHSAHAENLSEVQQKNISLAKTCFSIMNDQYSFKKTTPQNEIIVNTPTGEIYFEYLSSGFKSILYILLGIIKELEYRFQKEHIAAETYDGLILIDEVELHLHPEWQGRVCTILKVIFPKAQFFITTHSPHVVQSALQGEVIALERKENEVICRDLPTSEYGYQGWTIEEVLKDIMGMPDLRTKKYDEVKQRFDSALDNQNINEAREAYNELDKMLHPQYPLRPVFRMQLDSLGE